MKESYLAKDFKKTAAQRFPEQADALRTAFDARLRALRQENAGASPEMQLHLESQILPGIAAYETLQSVMPKEQALEAVHSYVERRAHQLKRIFLCLMRIPGLYRRVPGIFPGRPRGFSEPPPASRQEKFRRPTASGASI